MANLSWSSSISFLLLSCLLPPNCYSTDDPDTEGEALTEVITALNDSSHKISWDSYLVSPCSSWSHVTCRDGRVLTLSLPSYGFTGTLSPSIGKLKLLVTLDLHDNNLCGALPDSLGNLSFLENLNLGNNNFNGSIPESWGQLSNLKYLDLSSNCLVGNMPHQLLSTPVFNFTATHLTCDYSAQKPCISRSSVPVSTRKSNVQALATAAFFITFYLIVAGAVCWYRAHRVNNHKQEIFVDVDGEDEHKISLGQIRRFSLREMESATENFSEGNVIGQGGYGKVYRGILGDNARVAVKRLMDYHSPGGEAAFLREISLISVAVHKNLLRLIGYCTTETEKILVYPFMQNLSVASHLRDLKAGEEGLQWAVRKRIALGTALGLEYLHDHCNPKIIHRDMKAANILLNDDLEPVIGDFGLAKLVDTGATHVTTQVRGTLGHIAPEYLSTGKSSEKTDVFGYGITLFELVTGQRAIDLSRLDEEEDVLLLDHMKMLVGQRRLDAMVDDKLKVYDDKEVETIVQVAILCTQTSPEKRPKMAEVVTMLQGGVGLAERWAEWEQVRSQELSSLTPHQNFTWAQYSTHEQHAIQLSKAR